MRRSIGRAKTKLYANKFENLDKMQNILEDITYQN